jgi:hypothetical protein
MRLEKNLLTLVNPGRYSALVAETTANRGDSRKFDRRTTAAARFFYVRTPSRAYTINGRALAGASSDAPVSYRAGLSTWSMACPPHLTVDGRLPSSIGGRILRQALARPEHSQFPNTLTDIVNRALRDAATAPTVFDALDVCGDALRRLADISRAEVSRG